MNTLQVAIWRRIDGYAFDDIDSALPFSARLARDNGWSPAFAQRALQEYKRFILLAMTAGHPVTPSEEVDQVWHLHLLYTRSYWEDFCAMLGGPLHHGPTKGGVHEGRKFNTWYENTLHSYAQVFAVAPPSDIWPEPTRRFGEAAHFKRINTRTCWVIPKPHLSAPLILVAVVTPLAGLAGCENGGDTDMSWIAWIVFFAFAMVGIWKDRHRNGKGPDGGGGGGCGGSGCGGGGCGG